MNSNKFIQNHPSLHNAEELKQICAPLTKLGIVYFSHAHIDETSQLSCLALNPEFFKLYFDKSYYHFDLHKGKKPTNTEEFVIWDAVVRKKETQSLDDDFKAFGLGHTFSIIHSQETTTDYYHFATKLENPGMNEKYFRNMDLLKRFISYFKGKVANHKELASAYDLKLGLQKDIGGYYTEENLEPINRTAFEEATMLDKIYLVDSNIYITKREFDVLHSASLGKTSKDIAQSLGITSRTVKAHMHNIKSKLNCQNQFQLGLAFSKISQLTAQST